MFAVLTACSGGSTSKGDVGVDGLTVSDCLSGGRPEKPAGTPEADTAMGPSVLTVTASGGGEVAVVHESVSGTCCVGFDVVADADAAAMTVAVTYEETGDPCDCMCAYDFAYSLTGLTPGDWTITAAGDTATVTVE